MRTPSRALFRASAMLSAALGGSLLISPAGTKASPIRTAALPAGAAAAPPSTATRPGTPAVARSDIEITHAWIRWLPANAPGGGYMTLLNHGAHARVITGASSPDYASISFHQTRLDHGISSMTPVDVVRLDPQTPVRFAPGGYHLMLMQPTRTLAPGDTVPVTLTFDDGASRVIVFAVRSAVGENAP